MKTNLKILLAALLLAVSSGASPAFAYAFLRASIPAANSTVASPPETLLLTFTKNVEAVFCRVLVTDSKGMNDAAGKPLGVPGHPNQLMVKLNITTPGKIIVAWHALSTDTTRTKGTFSFTVSQ